MKRYVIGLIVTILVFFGVLLTRAFLVRCAPPTQVAASDIKLSEKGIVSRLAGAVRLPTISHLDRSKTDFSVFQSLLEHIQRSFPKVHARLSREVIGKYSLLYEWKGKNPSLKPVLLMGHMDVVPVSPGTERDWTQGAFSGVVVDGYLWGRGTLDDKVGVIGILEAVEWLISQNLTPERTIYLAFGHDEEVGGDLGAGSIAKRMRAAELSFDWILDEGGVLTENIVEGVKPPVALIGIAEKGYFSVELTASAVGGHSSMPPPRTAIGALSRAMKKLEESPMPASMKGPVKHMLTSLAPEMSFGRQIVMANLWLFEPLVIKIFSGNPQTNASIRTTTAPTIFNSGDKDNVLPAQAKATVNFRILPGETRDMVLAHIKKVIDDPQIEVKGQAQGNDPSEVSSVESEGYRLLERTIRKAFPGTVVSPYLTVGGTDTVNYRGLSANVYRFLPVKFGPADMSRMHGTNERISVQDYLGAVRFYIELIREGASLTSPNGA